MLDPAENDEKFFANDIFAQLVAKGYADQFMAHSHTPPKNVDFVVPSMIRTPDGKLFACEAVLEGKFTKYTNNSVYKNADFTTPLAFSHFTYERSKHREMVVDLQGVGYMLTDPQVHDADGPAGSSSSSSAPPTFGLGNTGEKGIKEFFHDHECNAVCTHLGLKANSMMVATMKPPAGVRPLLEHTMVIADMQPSAGLCLCGNIIPNLTKEQFLNR